MQLGSEQLSVTALSGNTDDQNLPESAINNLMKLRVTEAEGGDPGDAGILSVGDIG